MSKATKCDRCGRCFCASDLKDILVSFDEVIWSDGESRKDFRYTERKNHLDFCPDCTWAFTKFMDDWRIEQEEAHEYAH